MKFQPGLVGGHCIGVDPYYLTHKAKELGYHAKIINSGRAVNDSMGAHVGRKVAKKIISGGTNMRDAKVLVMGATFKEDVSDIRNSKVVDVINELKSFSCNVDVVDPHADSNELKEEYDFELVNDINGNLYDAIIVAVNHLEYKNMNEQDSGTPYLEPSLHHHCTGTAPSLHHHCTITTRQDEAMEGVDGVIWCV